MKVLLVGLLAVVLLAQGAPTHQQFVDLQRQVLETLKLQEDLQKQNIKLVQLTERLLVKLRDMNDRLGNLEAYVQATEKHKIEVLRKLKEREAK